MSLSLANAVTFDSFLGEMNATAEGIGDQTKASAVAEAFDTPRVAVGFAAAVSLAEGPSPFTTASTAGPIAGSPGATSHTDHVSIDFGLGPAPLSLDISLTVVSIHTGAPTPAGGDFVGGHPGPGLAADLLGGHSGPGLAADLLAGSGLGSTADLLGGHSGPGSASSDLLAGYSGPGLAASLDHGLLGSLIHELL